MARPTSLSTRPSAALRLLRDIAGRPPPARWSWAVMTLEPAGPGGAPGGGPGGAGYRDRGRGRGAGGRPGAVLVLRADPGGTGAGALLALDGRGRARLPVWWRRACTRGACAVATRAGTGVVGAAPLVVLAPTGVLDGLADVLVGERR